MNTLTLKPVTNDKKNQEIEAFIRNNIADFKGEIEEAYPLPRMLFKSQELAHLFADKLSKSLNIPKRHFIVVTATSERMRVNSEHSEKREDTLFDRTRNINLAS